MSCLGAEQIASPDEVIVTYQRIMTKIIVDNYSIMFVYVVIVVLLLLIAYYFLNNIRKTIKSYKKNSDLVGLAPPQENNVYDPAADNEKYTENNRTSSKDASLYNLRRRDDPIDYINKTKKDFLADVDNQYGEYNTAKSEYIKTTYNRRSDDVVDQNILFSRHDDYTYKPHDTD